MRSLPIIVLMLSVALHGAQAQPPATTRASDELRRWFDSLADPEPAAREQARANLLKLPASRLDELRKIVAAAHSIAPSQCDDLQQIVQHVFLTAQPYPLDKNRSGFLGVTLADVEFGENSASPNAGGGEQTTRVAVQNRLRGFGAYPVLRDGDLILRVVETDRRLYNADDLKGAIAPCPPGETIHLEIQRDGKLMQVAVKLYPRPGGREELTFNPERFEQERDAAAQKYWDEHFAPLVSKQ